jgi:hypothetical protein
VAVLAVAGAGAALAASAGTGPPAGAAARPAKMSAGDLISLLRGLLPAGKISRESGTVRPGPSARLVLHNRRGTATVVVDAGRLPASVSATATACPFRADRPYDRCTRRELADGAVLVVDKGHADPLNPASPPMVSAWLTSRSREVVEVTEAAAVSGKASAASRPTLPVTAGRLAAVVCSAAWAPVLATLPPLLSAPPPPSRPAMTARQILATVSRLLPRGLRVTGTEGGAGYADLTVDDGHGTALVTVTAQQWQPHNATIAKLFASGQAGPAGTRVMTSHVRPASRTGAAQWEVDTLAKDGLRILVTEINAAAYGLPVTRADPPITLHQLTAIATSASWRN